MRAKLPYKKRPKRVGRGEGSGHGKTSCRGHKGQGARSGSGKTPGFEGGQMPFIRRLPKRGFNRYVRKRFQIVNLGRLAELGEKEITPEKLLGRGVIKEIGYGLKILGDGKVTKPLEVHAHRFSAQAREKLEKAGGKALIISAPAKSEVK